MLPRVVTDFFFFLNNQPDALIIRNLFCHKILHVSGNFFAHHQEFSTVYSALVSFMQLWWPLPSRIRMEHPDSAWKRPSKTCMKLNSAECTVENSWWWAKNLPETYRVLWQNKFRIISASGWLLKKEVINTVTNANYNFKYISKHFTFYHNGIIRVKIIEEEFRYRFCNTELLQYF